MFGFSIIQIILAAAGVAAVVGGGWAITNHFENNGERRIEAKYAPMVAACPDEAKFFGGTKKVSPEDCAKEIAKGKEAVAANQTLQDDLKRLILERQSCNDEVGRIQRQGQRAAAISAARKPADDQQIATISAEKQALIDALGLPQAGTCEQRLARRDALWAKIAAQRTRDFPPTGAAPASGDVSIRPPK